MVKRVSREMKDSGVEWIGEVPDSWSVRRIKDFYTIKSGSGISKDEYVDDGIYPIIGSNGIIGYSNKSNNSHEVITTGRVGTIGSSRLVNKCWITDNTLILDKHTDINNNFTNLILPLLDYDFISTGTAQPLITATKLKNQYIPIPDIEEQNTISTYLKNIVTVLESIIQKTKSTIEDYKLLKQSIITEAVTKGLDKNVEMKDSGIEWIGEMPKNWRINKLKYCGELSANGVDKKIRPDEKLYRSVHYTDVYRNSLYNLKVSNDFLVVSADDNKAISTELKKGDILLTNSSETPDDMGHSTLIADDFSKILQGYHLMRFRPNLKLCGLFLKYFLGCHYSRNWFSYRSTGITRYGITKDGFAELKILIPPIKEQEQIGKYLEKRCSILDDLISKKLSLIEELEIFKKSLIYEYVTGKKEVE